MRIWISRIPEETGTLYAFAEGAEDGAEPIGFASLYGRGVGSDAKQKMMLYFILRSEALDDSLQVDTGIEIKIGGAKKGEYLDIELDVVEVE